MTYASPLTNRKYALGRKGMKVNEIKTEYMCVNERESVNVKLQGAEIVKVDEFKYLESTIQSDGQGTSEVRKRVWGK